MLSGLPCGSGLLGVAVGGVPAGGGEGDEDEGGEDHCGGAAVLASAKGVTGSEDSPRGRSEGAVVGSGGAFVGAGGALEGAGRLGQFPAGGGRGRLGEGVEEFSSADELGDRGVLVVLVEDGSGPYGGGDGVPAGGGRARPGALIGIEGTGFQALADLGEGEVGGRVWSRRTTRVRLLGCGRRGGRPCSRGCPLRGRGVARYGGRRR